MNLILFIITLVISASIIRIGAIAFELTGLEVSIAQFQALSCFTGTGFTTREAEKIVVTPQRRRIAAILMTLGYGGIVTLIATFANTLQFRAGFLYYRFPYIKDFVPKAATPWVNLALLVIAVIAVFKIMRSMFVTSKLTRILKGIISMRSFRGGVSLREFAVGSGGYGVCTLRVRANSHLVGKHLHDLTLRKHNIVVVGIERKTRVFTMPTGETRINPGDKLICFGRTDRIKKRLA